MKKAWWLDLYTIPFLKKVAIAWVASSVLISVIIMFIPEVMSVCYAFPFYVAFVAVTNIKTTLFYNIEFHKLHVSYQELRAAVIKELVTYMLALSFCAITLGSLTHFLAPGALELLFIMAPILGASVLFGFSLNPKNSGTNIAKYNLTKDHIAFSSIWGVVFFLFSFFFSVVFALLHMNPFMIMGSAMLGFVFASSFYAFKACFHQVTSLPGRKLIMKYTMVLPVFFFALIMGVSLLGRPVITNKDVSPELRVLFFEANGALGPELDIDDAKFFLKQKDIDAGLVFLKTPELKKYPAAMIVGKADSSLIYEYVAIVKPSTENMTFILNQMAKKSELDFYDRRTSSLILKQWPKHEQFPEHLISKHMKKSEVPQERVPASEN